MNREFMTRLLIEEGRKRPMSQYSFITPQLVNIHSDENIKIHKYKSNIFILYLFYYNNYFPVFLD